MVNAYDAEQQMDYGTELPLSKPVFPRGQRRALNMVAICIGLFVPWILFSVLYAVFSFSLHYQQPDLTYFIAFLGLLVVLVFAYLAFCLPRRMGDMQSGREPSWFTFLFATCLLAWAVAIILGQWNFWYGSQRYYDLMNLNSYPAVDPMYMRGQQLMDAGHITFTRGSHLDLNLATGFRNDDTYCVAPITIGSERLATYDFWAVGINCCTSTSIGHDHYHCGEFNNPRALSGLRLMRDDERAFYRLAVQQAQSAYNIEAVHPLFFRWMEDPEAEIQSYRADSFRYYLLGIFTYFVFQLFLVIAATLAFSKMGYF